MLLGTEKEVTGDFSSFPYCNHSDELFFFHCKKTTCNSVATRSLKSGLSYNYLFTNVEQKLGSSRDQE